jgi:REP element-mobilizing transposase RayT
MVSRSTSHAIYEAKYHIVWCPKYRKKLLVEEMQKRVKEILSGEEENFIHSFGFSIGKKF